MNSTIRSLRSIRIQHLREMLSYMNGGTNLGPGTEHYAVHEHQDWRQAWGSDDHEKIGRLRRRCTERVAMEIEAEIAILNAITDDAYQEATRKYPLSHWAISPAELGHYCALRGIEGRQWYERFPMGANVRAGMGGYGWYRVGGAEQLTYAEVEPILGHSLATSQDAPKWASESRRAAA